MYLTPIIMPFGMSLSVVGKTVLAQAGTQQFRSTDGGQTWVEIGLEANSSTVNTFLSVAVSERTFYKAGTSGYLSNNGWR